MGWPKMQGTKKYFLKKFRGGRTICRLEIKCHSGSSEIYYVALTFCGVETFRGWTFHLRTNLNLVLGPAFELIVYI
jgi:hypothetical protein